MTPKEEVEESIASSVKEFLDTLEYPIMSEGLKEKLADKLTVIVLNNFPRGYVQAGCNGTADYLYRDYGDYGCACYGGCLEWVDLREELRGKIYG